MSNHRHIALDIGTKTCGIAITDALGMTTQPLETLRYKDQTKRHVVFEGLLKNFKEYEPQTVVVGLPLNMDGTEGSQVQFVRDWVSAFQKYLRTQNIDDQNYEWIFHDERCTSQMAESFLLDHDVSRAKRKEVIDKMAAVFILQSYLEN